MGAGGLLMCFQIFFSLFSSSFDWFEYEFRIYIYLMNIYYIVITYTTNEILKIIMLSRPNPYPNI